MERWTRSSWTRPSKKVEVFIVLPCRRKFGGVLLRILLQPGLEAAELAALQAQVIIDEHVAELRAKQRIFLQRVERLGEACGEPRALGGVGLVVARAGRGAVLDAVEPGDDLRGDIEV